MFAFVKLVVHIKRSRSHGDQQPTLVFQREDLQRIWRWEVESGHFPSSQEIPRQIGFTTPPWNPALPPTPLIPPKYRPPAGRTVTQTEHAGPKRKYINPVTQPPNTTYPPRPVPGSVADLDVIMQHCDFSRKKYVRDCLEVLRVGAGLDNENRMRRTIPEDWKYIYVEEGGVNNTVKPTGQWKPETGNSFLDPNSGLVKKPGAEWEDELTLPPVRGYETYAERKSPCETEDGARVFHMFWTGPFTDKPYLALLSFLYTQNLGLHLDEWPSDSKVCRPQVWLWINPGPAAAVPNPNALHDMFDQLKSNPWAAPFIHPRFKDVIQFKLWNTTEQLNAVPELAKEWSALKETLFNSGGHVIKVPHKDKPVKPEPVKKVKEEKEGKDGKEGEEGDAPEITAPLNETASKEERSRGDTLWDRTGSSSSSTYDRLSVILSDMARFVLCHRFGGVYLDADTIFLRDWEELLGSRNAFAYCWSRLPSYNTAVLKLNKGSALGTFLFRTALKNLLDFHPMTASIYVQDAYLEPLLQRLPDALFDSAWLNTEYYQRDRPPQPYFTEFGHFFDTPLESSASPQALGFDGFFKGAYSYHFHNFWWKPFDPARNWPDLGPRFKEKEDVARSMAIASAHDVDHDLIRTVGEDKRDLDWSTVLKRTFEAYIRGERPNMYGEWLKW